MTATRALFQGPGQPFAFGDVPTPPDLAPGECLVEILLSTLCGSDLHTVLGRRTSPIPGAFGHEAVGRVIAIGAGRGPGLVGQRVTWSLTDHCGTCPACTRWQLPQKCERLFKYGHAAADDGAGLNGCYASHIVLRAGTEIVPIPDSVSNASAAPANCALATMMAVSEPLRGGGDLAVIQGAGLLGLLGCALLRGSGWSRVVVVDHQPDRLAAVASFGGEPALGSAGSMVPKATADAVIEVTGNPAVVPEGLSLLRPGGHYAFAGMVHPQSRIELDGETIVRKCLTIRGTHNYSPRHLRAAVAFLAGAGKDLPWERIVSPPMPLSALDAAFELAKSGRWPRVSVAPAIS